MPDEPEIDDPNYPSTERQREILRRVVADRQEMENRAAERAARREAEQASGAADKIVSLPRRWWRVGIGIAAALVISVTVWLMSRPQLPERVLLTAVRERGGAVELPRNFALNVKSRELELSDGGDRLSGPIEPLAAESLPGVTASSVTLSGKDTAGTIGRFQGKLWLTNAAGRSRHQQAGGRGWRSNARVI